MSLLDIGLWATSFTSPTFRERVRTMRWWRGVLFATDDAMIPRRILRCAIMTWQFYRAELGLWLLKWALKHEKE